VPGFGAHELSSDERLAAQPAPLEHELTGHTGYPAPEKAAEFRGGPI
jgi:hypothetical protein